MNISPERPIELVIQPFQEFFSEEASGGIVLLACTTLALFWANSAWADAYHALWRTELGVSLGSWNFSESLHLWINDGLMAVFFFAVGLEIKRELLAGELASLKRATLPLAAAIGGMAAPAALFLALNAGKPGAEGWGIPMATDIAFALGVLALLGKRICMSIKVFLTALAIVDDIGAVIVIALFYTTDISLVSLAVGALFLGGLLAANRLGVHNLAAFAILGLGLWGAFLASGVHPTIAGVITALTVPARPRMGEDEFPRKGRRLLAEFESAEAEEAGILASEDRPRAARALGTASRFVQTPLQRLEHILHPWVAFCIVPLFALANAGISIGTEFASTMTDPVSLGIAAGLLVGKPAGITLFSWLAVRSGLSDLPPDILWKDVYAAGWVAGIGFTMSLFISNLAFGDSAFLTVAKGGVLSASLLAGIIGWLLFRVTKPCLQEIGERA